MKTIVAFLAKTLYAIVAALFTLAGAIVLAFNTGLLPSAVKRVLLEGAQGNLQTLHIAQELGTLLVFAGLISAWFLWHYEKSQFFHWSLTLFWGLLALVHWIDVRGTSADVGGNLVTTIPFLLFASLGLARAATEQSSPRRT